MRTGDVFELLRDGRPWTRSELAETTGLARSTVAARIDTLMRLGLIAPFGGGQSTGGRPPALFALNPAARVVVGVDIGATHARAVLSDLSGALLAEISAQIDIVEGPEVVLGWVVATIRAAAAPQTTRTPDDLAAIGIGLPGPVEHSTGRPINPPIMPGWDRYDVPGFLQAHFAVPVLIDNDVNIMALGERQTHLSDVDDLVLVKVATGIGGGIVSGGRLQRGAQGTAGDLGHVHVARARRRPVPLRQPRLPRGGRRRSRPGGASSPRAAVPATTGQDVVDLVRAGDPDAIDVVRQAGRDIGGVVATMVNVINPSVVVIGGQLSAAGEHLLAGIREVVYQRSLPLATEHLAIQTSRGRGRGGRPRSGRDGHRARPLPRGGRGRGHRADRRLGHGAILEG